MGRVNVFLTDELLQQINEEAKEEKTTRSALQMALESYIEAKRREREEEEKQQKMHKAARKMDALTKKLGKWNAQRIIRKYRESNLKTK